MNIIPSLLNKIKQQGATVALSSGVDSVSCVHFLATKFPKISLKCFHFNHQLRPQNDVMMKKAQELCKHLNLPFLVKNRQEHENDFSENGLRTIRYKAMSGLGNVITCHHLDDAVENYLFNCFNGVSEYLPIPLETEYIDFGLNVIRPFILNEKNELQEYAQKHNLMQFVEQDQTNSDQKYRRNWLRLSVVPLVQQNYNLKTIVSKKYKEKINKKPA
jgi:tRNA(Ile)-lysidine synthetase-like protein